MKQKLTLLLIALVTSMGAWATFSPLSGGYYKLRSASGTYLLLQSSDNNGSSTSAASYNTTGSYFTITTSSDNFVFQELNGHYIGTQGDNTSGWNVKNNASYEWIIEETGAGDGSYYIKRSGDNKFLGSDQNTNAGTGIYTNVRSANTHCKWYLDFTTTTEVTLVDGSNDPSGNLNALSGYTLTSKAATGLAGFELYGHGFGNATWFSTRCLSINTTAARTAEKVFLTAPTGYEIIGYSIECFTVSTANAPYMIDTNDDGTLEYSGTSVPGSKTTYKVSSIDKQTTFFWLYCNAGSVANYLGVSSFKVYLKQASPVTTSNAPAVNKCYTIQNPRGWWAVASSATAVNSTAELSLAHNASDPKQQFAFIYYDGTPDETDNGSYYLFSASEGKFAYADGTQLSLTDAFTDAVAASPVTFVASTSSLDKNPTIIAVNGDHFGVSTSKSPDVFKYNSTGDEGNASGIYEAGAFDNTDALAQIANTVSLEYHIIYDGDEKRVGTAKALAGSTLSLPSSLTKDYMTYTYYSDDKCTTEITTAPVGGGTIYAKESWNGPFTFSENFAGAKWYYAYERTSTQLYYKSSGGIDTSNDGEDEEKWAFMGDPYSGVKVINKAAGSGKYLTHNAATLSWDETATNWTMTAHPYDNAGILLYDVVSDNTYSIYLGSNGAVTALNAVVTAGNDTNKGGCLELTPVPDDYKDRVAANITPYFETLDVYYGLTTSDANTLKETYDYWDGETTCTETEYNTLYEAVMAAITYPSTPGFYRIRNYSTGRYLGNESGTAATFTSGSTASTVVYVTESEGKYTWKIQGSNAYSNLTVALGAPGLFTALNGTGTYKFVRDNAGTLEEWSAVNTTDTPQAYWQIEEVETVTIGLTPAYDKNGNQNTYATLCVPFNITGLTRADSKTVKAYAPTISLDGNYIVPGEGATTIAAGTPVILIGSDMDATSVTATIGSTYTTTPVTADVVLTGTFTAASIDTRASTGTNYVLGFDATSSRIGFYHVDNETFGLNANRAYLHIAKGGTVKGFTFSFDDDPDAIESPLGEIEDGAAIYNLAGQRISKMQKGINIVNGKKVLR